MAEGKTVNVKIRYDVDSSQVQKSEQLLKQAQAAANAFQQSAQKSGQNTTNSFNQANRSILAMEQELARLKTQISVASNPAAVKKLSDEYKKLAVQLRDATKQAYELPKAIKESDVATKSLTQSFGQFVTAAKLFITAGIVREAVNLTLEMAKLSGNVEGVERAFQRAFPNSRALLERLKEATHGTVNEFELMQRTLQATNLGVSVEQLPILFEFAATRAQQTGESVDYLVDSIVRGIGRKSILVLDNLGLSATRLREQFNGASLASQSVADVTKGVAEIAKIELQKMGGYAETSATKVDQLASSVHKLRVELSKKIESSGFIQLLNDAVEGARLSLLSNKELIDERSKLLASLDAERIIQSENFKSLEGDQQKKADFLQQEINSRQQLIGSYNDEISNIRRRAQIIQAIHTGEISNAEGRKQLYGDLYSLEGKNLDQRKKANFAFAEALANEEKLISKSIETWQTNKGVIEETMKILMQYLAELQKIGSETPEAPGLIQDLMDKIEALGDSIKSAKTRGEIEKLNVQLVNLEYTLRELQELGKTFVDPFGSLIFNMKNQPSDFLKIEKILPSSEQISKGTDDLTKKLADNMRVKMGTVGQAAAEGFIDHFKVYVEGNQVELTNTAIDIFADQLISFETAEIASLQNRLNNLRNFYDEQMILAGDNERAKDEMRLREERESSKLQKKLAEKERSARRFSIIVDTAAGIAKNMATYPYPFWIAPVAITAAQGASQLAIVNRTPARFAKGGLNIQGPGTGTSDSIPAQISRGESVMTASEWKTSKNVLKEVRAKRLDDRVLQDLKLGSDGVKYVGMDDKRIVKEIQSLKNSFPDVEARGNLLYTTRRKSENYKQWIRKSSMSE